MQQGKTQAEKRRDMNVQDQFGRLWLVAIEKENFEPTGGITPAGWTDPLRTPQHYIHTVKDNFGNPRLGFVEIDGKRWIADQEQATKEWTTRLWNIGRDQQKNAFDAKTAEKDDYLLHLTGPKPWPSPAILKRAFIGKEPKLLGLEELDRDTRMLLGFVELEDLEAITGEDLSDARGQEQKLNQFGEEKGPPPLNTGSWKEFVGACLERKIPMQQAAKMWKEFNAALKEA